MSKYDALGRYLRQQKADVVPMTFAEIERVTGAKLPNSKRYPAWWSNNTFNNVMTKVWLAAGFRTEQVDTVGKKLVFRRVSQTPSSPTGGMAEEAHEFVSARDASEHKQNRHPALGAMKGTFTIEPGYDLTSPIYTDEEWAEIEKEMSEDWDQIEQGLSGGRK